MLELDNSQIEPAQFGSALEDLKARDETQPKKRISAHAERHRDEGRRLLQAHPEIRELAGPRGVTALAPAVLLGLHWGMAWLVTDGGVLTVFVAAFFFGQLVLHATGALLHETAHKLIFRRYVPKLMFDLKFSSLFLHRSQSSFVTSTNTFRAIIPI